MTLKTFPGMVVDANSGVTLPSTVKFEVPYSFAKLSQSKATQEAYLLERWKWFNENLFGGRMTPPKFEIMKNMVNPKTLGLWFPGRNLIKLAGKLFRLPTDVQPLGTLVHEMAHQYVDTILQQRHEDAHGPTWKHVMVQVGMPPDAKYTGDYVEMLDKSQRDMIKVVKENVNPPLDEVQKNLMTFCLAIEPRKKKETPTVLVGSHGFVRSTDTTRPSVPVYTERQLGIEEFNWVYYDSLKVLDVIDARFKIPSVLRESVSKAKAQAIADYLKSKLRAQ